jgi:ParB family chromosome partitioning protein
MGGQIPSRRKMVRAARDARVVEIDRGRLAPGPWQPRRIFDADSLAELAISIRARGILSPLRVVPDVGHKRYLIVAGERRWRAAALAGLAEVPCLVMTADARSGAFHEFAILDNLHRANLRPGEEARAVTQLQHLGLTLHEVADRLGKSQGWVSQRLAIARLPESALGQLDDGSLTREEALQLARFADQTDLSEA